MPIKTVEDHRIKHMNDIVSKAMKLGTIASVTINRTSELSSSREVTIILNIPDWDQVNEQ